MEAVLEPAIVGREEELRDLRGRLAEAAEGHGGAVLVSGEAGIGKTRLLNELKRHARSAGFSVLSGHCLFESLTPYMPFLEALRSGGLKSLFAEEVPRVEGVYLVTDTGLPIRSVVREETGLDPDLFAAMLTSVGDFVRDSLSMLTSRGTEGRLNSLGYGGHRILIERARNTNLAVILTGKENEFLIHDMDEVLADIHRRHGSVLAAWDGDVGRLAGIEDLLRPLIASGKYDGIDYGGDPKARRNRLFENISLGLVRQARAAPTLLCLEDLHWADPSSLALMHYVARNATSCDLLILGTYRPEDLLPRVGRPHPLIETMRLMEREDLLRTLELRRLPEASVPAFLSALLGSADIDEESMALLHKETEGNPLFLVEIVRLLVHEGVLRRHEGAWTLSRSLGKVNLPSKIHDVVVRRLDRLDEEDRRILDYASVAGEVFASTVLAESLHSERIRLLERLKVLEKTHRLVHPREGSYRFDHAKIKEVLYDEIPPELRAEYHVVVADTIERLNSDDLEAVVGDLAFHYGRSGNREKACLYLTKAAERARGDYSNEEAIRFYGEALAFVEDRRRRMEVLKSLGEVLDLAGEYDRGLGSFEEALGLADDVRARTEIQAKIGGLYRKQGRYDESIRVSARALEPVRGQGFREEAACLNNLGVVHSLRGEYDEALEAYGEVLAILERIGDRRGIAACLNNIGLVHGYRGDYDKALGFYERSLATFQEIGELEGTANALNNVGMALQYRGRYDEALGFYERSLAINEKIGNHRGVAHIFNNFGSAHYDGGDYDRAREFYEKSLAICDRIGEKRESASNCCGLAETHLRKGDLAAAQRFCEKALALSEAIGARHSVGVARRILGTVRAGQGKWDAAAEEFRESIRTFEDLGVRLELGKAHQDFGLAWKRKGEREEARTQLAKALEIFRASRLENRIRGVEEALQELA